LSAASRERRSSPSTSGHARPDRQLAAQLRNDQHRRTAAAAAADARRRTVMALALCLLGMVAGAVVVEREAMLQGQEVRRG
jgi:hypothetical protein